MNAIDFIAVANEFRPQGWELERVEAHLCGNTRNGTRAGIVECDAELTFEAMDDEPRTEALFLPYINGTKLNGNLVVVNVEAPRIEVFVDPIIGAKEQKKRVVTSVTIEVKEIAR